MNPATMKPFPCGAPTIPQGKIEEYDDGGPVTSIILADFPIAVSRDGRQTHLQNKAEYMFGTEQESGPDCREIAIERFIHRVGIEIPEGVPVFTIQEKCNLLWAFKLGWDTANRDWNLLFSQEDF